MHVLHDSSHASSQLLQCSLSIAFSVDFLHQITAGIAIRDRPLSVTVLSRYGCFVSVESYACYQLSLMDESWCHCTIDAQCILMNDTQGTAPETSVIVERASDKITTHFAVHFGICIIFPLITNWKQNWVCYFFLLQLSPFLFFSLVAGSRLLAQGIEWAHNAHKKSWTISPFIARESTPLYLASNFYPFLPSSPPPSFLPPSPPLSSQICAPLNLWETKQNW